MIEYIPLWTLLAKQRESLCREFFIQVYNEAFPNPDQREGPDTWLPLMGNHIPHGQPKVHMILACEATEILGGIVFELMPETEAWFCTFIAVRPDARNHGIARRLMHDMLSYIFDRSSSVLLFAEAEDPSRIADHELQDIASHRLDVLDRFGFRQLPFQYVQPALNNDSKPLDDLLLLCYAPDEKPPYACIAAHRICEFLNEFYTALEQSDSQYLKEMCAELELMGCIQVKRLTEVD